MAALSPYWAYKRFSGPAICWARRRPACKAVTPLLRHKTTARAAYDAGWKAAVANGGFDALFVNERGEVTEGGRSSLFICLNGQWCTPPLQSGVLPGVLREQLLNPDASVAQVEGTTLFNNDLTRSILGKAQERVLYPEDIRKAEAPVVVNALRGVIPVKLSEPTKT